MTKTTKTKPTSLLPLDTTRLATVSGGLLQDYPQSKLRIVDSYIGETEKNLIR